MFFLRIYTFIAMIIEKHLSFLKGRKSHAQGATPGGKLMLSVAGRGLSSIHITLLYRGM